MVRIALPACLALLLVACSEPRAPDREQPPEPQAARRDDLRRAIDRPLDRARQAQAGVDAAATAQRAAIDAAERGADAADAAVR